MPIWLWPLTGDSESFWGESLFSCKLNCNYYIEQLIHCFLFKVAIAQNYRSLKIVSYSLFICNVTNFKFNMRIYELYLNIFKTLHYHLMNSEYFHVQLVQNTLTNSKFMLDFPPYLCSSGIETDSQHCADSESCCHRQRDQQNTCHAHTALGLDAIIPPQ